MEKSTIVENVERNGIMSINRKRIFSLEKFNHEFS